MIKITKHKRLKKGGLLLLLSLFLAAVAVAFIFQNVAGDQAASTVVESEPNPNVELSFVAVGDDLIHGAVYRTAKEAAGGEGYDFTPVYKAVEPLIKGSDVAFINQETPLGGTALGISSYPAFNSPQELGDYLHSVGFNLICHANNHILDKGSKGMRATLEYWKQYSDVAVAGAYLNKEASDSVHMIEKKGVKIAFLAYTYGTNGLSLPRNSEMIVAGIGKDKIAADVTKANAVADLVVVSMHWGNEYQTTITEQEKDLAQYLANLGVDIVVGHHPHVIQNMATLTGKYGNKTVVAYSLGNFVSAQHKSETMLGGMMKAKIIYNTDTKQVKVENARFIPLVTHYDKGVNNVRVIPFADYTEELALVHGIRAYESYFSKSYLQSLLYKVVLPKYIATE